MTVGSGIGPDLLTPDGKAGALAGSCLRTYRRGSHSGNADFIGTEVHAHRGACFADAAELIAGGVQAQLGCRLRRREVRCGDRDRLTDVAGWVGLLHRQHLLVDLRR